MESLFSMIEDRRQILRIFRYCRRHSVPFTAKCEELICIESKLSLLDVKQVFVRCRTPFEDWEKRETCLIMKARSSSFDLHLSWPCQQFALSFQHRSMGHSFHTKLLRFVPRAQIAVFSFPKGIYKRRLRENLRIPVEPTDGIRVILGQHDMVAFNLAMEGIGFYLPSAHFLRIGQVVSRLQIEIRQARFQAAGKVRHVSTSANGQHVCGMSIEDMSQEAQAAVREFIVAKQLISAGISMSAHLSFERALKPWLPAEPANGREALNPTLTD